MIRHQFLIITSPTYIRTLKTIFGSEQIQAYANTFRKKTVSNNSTSKPRIAHIPTTTSPLFLRTEIILYGSEQKKGV